MASQAMLCLVSFRRIGERQIQLVFFFQKIMSSFSLDKTNADIAAVQLEIAAASEERKLADECLKKAIEEGKPDNVLDCLRCRLEIAFANLTALRREKDRLLKTHDLILSKQSALTPGTSNGMFSVFL
jgi:hypothetical protein